MVTYTLIAVNVAVYLLSPMSLLAVWYGAPESRGCAIEEYLLRWAAFPAALLTGTRLTAEQAAAFTPCPLPSTVIWPGLSAVTSMFLHADAFHLTGNMVYLFVFGPCVEDRLGRFRYPLIYLGTGVAACYGFSLAEGPAAVPMVGASGAISGVLGTYLVVQFRSRVTTLLFGILPVRLPGWVLVATFFRAGLPALPEQPTVSERVAGRWRRLRRTRLRLPHRPGCGAARLPRPLGSGRPPVRRALGPSGCHP